MGFGGCTKSDTPFGGRGVWGKMRGMGAVAVRAIGVAVDEESLSVDLTDGRTITMPLSWYPRLLHGSSAERANWRLLSRGGGIH